ncbi:MAG TPA: SDR family oxidoreductase [Thermoanaerobaculia bacterium]
MLPATLITGASSGIGRELTKLFAEDRQDLVLVARNRKKLDEFARDLTAAFGVAVRVIARDLARPDAPAEIAKELSNEGIVIHTLVNNAGFGAYGPFGETDGAKELEMLQVNIGALTQLTKLFLPPMLERKSGRILNVASTAAFQPGPLMAVYYASKAYVLSFTEALANEVAAQGVVVTALCPGPTDTEFQKEAGLEETHLFRSPFVQDARSVARAGYAGLAAGKRIVIPGIANQVLAQAVRFSPRRLVTASARWFQEQKKKKA